MIIPEVIIKDFKNKRGVLFLGAGISLNCDDKEGFPDGKEFARLLSKKFLNREPNADESLMQIAQQTIWQNNGSRQPLESYLKDIFSAPSVHPLPPHNALAQLNVPMISTNYDRLIEDAFRRNNLRLSIILEGRDLIEHDRNLLIKIHGCVSNPANCIISEEDYYRWLTFESEVKNLIRAWFLMYRIVFVGYSLSDINFRQLIIELRRKFGSSFRNCYIVTPHVDRESYNYKFLTNTIGAQFIEADAKNFLESLVSILTEGGIKYTETDLKEEYFKLNINQKKSFNEYASERIFEMIINNNAGPLELDEDIAEKIYQISRSKREDLYKANTAPGIPLPKGMTYIPPGEFIMGGSRLGNELIRVEKIDRGYFIDECLITNKDYRKFLKWIEKSNDHRFCHKDEPPDKSHKPHPDFSGKSAKDVKLKALPDDYFTNSLYDDYPVVNVDWWDAFAYSRWVGKRLPSEKEWEKAARGIDGRIYPYGNTFDPGKSNVAESGIYHTTPVKKYRTGKSPYGCYDMSGNAWEWCLDTFEFNTDSKKATRVVRGGSCTRGIVKAPSSFRNGRHPGERWITRSFRCVKDLEET
jgi:formylglycine-generating enzyme required for sulfatase activity/NAD-dependent SIR2 family protein deacetylase